MEVHLGRRIAYARKKNKLTQTDFAKKIHVSSSHLGNIETGKYQASNDIILLMSQSMDVPISYFLNWDKVNEVTGEIIEMLFQAILNNDLEEAKQLLKSLKHPIECIQQEISFNMLRAVYHIKKGRINKALEIEEEYLSLFLPISNIEEYPSEFQLYYYYFLMQINFVKEEYERSYSYGNEILNICSDDFVLINILINLSNISMRLSLYEESLTYINKAICKVDERDYSNLTFVAYIQLSALLINSKQYDKALNIVDRLRKLAEQNESEQVKSIAYQHIGTIYFNHEQYEKSLYYFKESEKNNIQLPIEIIQTIITCYLKLNHYEKASYYIEKGESYITTEYNKMIILAQKAELYLLEGNEKMHWKIQKKTIHFFIKNNYLENLRYIYTYLGKYYYVQKRYKESATYFMEMERIKDEEKKNKTRAPLNSTMFLINTK
ncbi:helix-turn-helix transcriptional regulator [Bacillus sp. AGMB 02131]|uniref:Helix-turn-helix transcriptional regulator n=1 Tax=Peribacillus faecalis TaxID=2772559 RepID=A0A927H9L0_9BACI|nr:helix-turn-helix transcriptional regulator [Peribacillus faecalis]MBD3107705.1 helix-turn-helix transcriptional regulator [Peribacillus faecalis]